MVRRRPLIRQRLLSLISKHRTVILRAYAAGPERLWKPAGKTILPPELPPAAISDLPRCGHKAGTPPLSHACSGVLT
jgi:hypothetical protein